MSNLKGLASSFGAVLVALAAHGSSVGLCLDAPVSSWDDGNVTHSLVPFPGSKSVPKLR